MWQRPPVPLLCEASKSRRLTALPWQRPHENRQACVHAEFHDGYGPHRASRARDGSMDGTTRNPLQSYWATQPQLPAECVQGSHGTRSNQEVMTSLRFRLQTDQSTNWLPPNRSIALPLLQDHHKSYLPVTFPSRFQDSESLRCSHQRFNQSEARQPHATENASPLHVASFEALHFARREPLTSPRLLFLLLL